MLFNSPQFLLFLILVAGINFILRVANKRLFLLFASLFFIGFFNIASLAAVLFLSGFTFFVGSLIKGQRTNRLYYLALSVNVAAIMVFNYFLSVNSTLRFNFNSVDFNTESFLLMIGLSFYSLQHIAYLIDVKKQRLVAEKIFTDFLLYSVYFPKFMSGPIALHQQMRLQNWEDRPSGALMWQGFNRILMGFFKKMVIADRLAPSVHSIFDFNDTLPGLTVLAGGVLFTIQLYFDFSGYCDIAIGASKLLGIELPENFDFPLRARSITSFWRKWHLSLIHFFTTYIFYPLSFKYRHLKKTASAIAVLATFFVSALWHGLGFTFLLWAFCHTSYLLVELYFRKPNEPEKNRFRKGLKALSIFLLVSFSHLFFRSMSFGNCKHLISELFSTNFLPTNWRVDFIAPIAVGGHQTEHFNFLVTIVFIALFLILERKIFSIFSSRAFRPLFSFLFVILIFLFGVFNNGERFIYMQF